MSSGFKTSKVLVSHSKSPSLIFDQRILKSFKIVSGYEFAWNWVGAIKVFLKQYVNDIFLSGRNISLKFKYVGTYFEWELIGVILKYVKEWKRKYLWIMIYKM